MASDIPRFTAQQVADAITEAKGLISIAAKTLNCDPATVRRYARKYETVANALHDADEQMKDFAESKLFLNIQAGKEASIFFYLKTKAKDRGYIERQEVTGVDGGAILVKIDK